MNVVRWIHTIGYNKANISSVNELLLYNTSVAYVKEYSSKMITSILFVEMNRHLDVGGWTMIDVIVICNAIQHMHSITSSYRASNS